MNISLSRRRLFAALSLTTLSALFSAAPAFAQEKIKFTLDWRFEGPAAPFLLAKSKGYFAAEGLDVTIDSGSGSAGAVTRVATGAYEMGFADFNALVEQEAKQPGSKVTAVYMVYNNSPAAVVSLKKSGFTKPSDLLGKTLAAPVFDAGRKAWPAFAKSNKIAVDGVKWQSVDPALRETLLAKGDVDAITGFYFTSVLNMEARGVKAEDLAVMEYGKMGVEAYGNAIIVSHKFMSEKPEAVKGFLRAFNKALKEVIANPSTSASYVKAQDALANEALENRRLKMAIDSNIITDETRANGLGDVQPERLKRAIAETVDAYGLPATPPTAELFNAAFLPAKADRMFK